MRTLWTTFPSNRYVQKSQLDLFSVSMVSIRWLYGMEQRGEEKQSTPLNLRGKTYKKANNFIVI